MAVFHAIPQNEWCTLALALASVWKSCGKTLLSAGLTPCSEPLINGFQHKQQSQFALARGEVCHGHNGNQTASAFERGFE